MNIHIKTVGKTTKNLAKLKCPYYIIINDIDLHLFQTISRALYERTIYYNSLTERVTDELYKRFLNTNDCVFAILKPANILYLYASSEILIEEFMRYYWNNDARNELYISQKHSCMSSFNMKIPKHWTPLFIKMSDFKKIYLYLRKQNFLFAISSEVYNNNKLIFFEDKNDAIKFKLMIGQL